MKSELIDLFNNYNGKPNAFNWYIMQTFPDLYKSIEDNSSFWKQEKVIPFSIKFLWYVFDINDYPICPICKNQNLRITTKPIHSIISNPKLLYYCGRKCLEIGENTRELTIQNNLKKYGTEYPAQSQQVKDKIKETLFKNYGKDGLKNSIISNKKKETCLKKYGTEYSCQSKEVKEKIQKTFNEKYNGHPLRDSDIQNKFRQTCMEHFGTIHHMKNDEIKDKLKSTMVSKYGVQSIFQNKEYSEKIRNIILDKYGVDNVSKNDTIKEKKIESSIKRYNTQYVFQSEEVKNKIKQTILDKYGVDNVSKNSEIHQKQIDSIIRKRRELSYDNIMENDKYVTIISDKETYINNFNSDITWKCKQCGDIFITKKNPSFIASARCYKCFPKNYFSQENEIYDFLKSILPNDEIIRNSKSIISPKKLDIYIPNKKIAIEFDGLYWHSTQYGKDEKYHLSKTEQCIQQGIQLIHIFEDEWSNKQDIVKDRLKSVLGLYDIKLGARLCQIKQVPNEITKQFLNDNHIQGYINNKYSYGLYYKDELVSMMTFGSYRKSLGRNSKDNEYELLRFCNKRGYQIVGGASKLLKKFINDVQPSKIISYADRRWSIGKLYESVGFQFVHNSSPNYWYLHNNQNIRESRFKYRKSELSKVLNKFDESLSEEMNMLLNDYYRIYDCGNMLYELKI